MLRTPCLFPALRLTTATTTLLRSRVRSMSSSSVKIAVIAAQGHPGLALVPSSLQVSGKKVDFQRVHSLADIDTNTKADAMLYLPPGQVDTLETSWKQTGPVPWIHIFSAGCDSIMPLLGRLNLVEDETFTLTNGKSAFSDSLAEFALLAMLYFNKQVPRLEQNKENKIWDHFVMNTIAKKKVSFVGFGHIAQTTARKLQAALDVEISVLKRSKCDPNSFGDIRVKEVFSYEAGEKNQAFENADFVICTLPGTEQTRDFVGTDQFKAMKSSSVFLSMGRGLVVDEDALAEALENEQIAGAALDVFKTEPLPETSALWKCKNLLVSPHNADYTDDYFKLGWEVFLKNLEAFIDKKEFFTPVDKHQGY